MNDENIVRFEGVSLGYGRETILEGVDLQLSRGDYLGVVGPNGAGKTTLLMGLLGILPARVGRVVRSPDIRFGYVPQRQTLDDIFPLTVADVVLMARDVGVTLRSNLGSLLDRVGLSGRENAFYSQLSGGQRQRVLLARALALDPTVLVLDEPTNGLDFPSETSLMELFREFNLEGRTVIMVTHMLNLVANHARTLALVGAGEVVTGIADDLLTEEALQGVYGRGLVVGEVAGHRVLVPAQPGRRSDPEGQDGR